MITGWAPDSPEDRVHRLAVTTMMAIAAARLTDDKTGVSVLFEAYIADASAAGLDEHHAWLVYAVAATYWIGALLGPAAEQMAMDPVEAARFLLATATLEAQADA